MSFSVDNYLNMWISLYIFDGIIQSNFILVSRMAFTTI
jgi:hypothetical protein